jgi:arginyl-tRNA synthetase
MKKLVAEILQKALKTQNLDVPLGEIESKVGIPPSNEMGDFSFPCFFLADQLKLNPVQIALNLRENIGNPPEEFEDIQTAGPYINFFVNRGNMALNLVKEILKQKEKYGSSNIGKGKKSLVEHTSINPNSSPHVGRARNAIIGDSIVKILDFLNFKTEVHYYVNDVSKQIAMLVVAGAEKKTFDEMLQTYINISKKVEKDPQIEEQVFFWLRRFEAGDKVALSKFKKITDTCIKGQKEILRKIGINYHFFDYESTYIKKARKILEEFKKKKKLHIDKDGRLYLDQKDTPLKKMMKSAVLVLTRSDETGLYPLRDLAYNIDKMKKAEKNIWVLGEDHKLYYLQIQEALKLLNKKVPEVVHYSFILLSSHGKSKKMSTRKGDVVLLEDFLDDVTKKAEQEIKKRKTQGDPKKVAIASIKYKILKNSPNKIINFDMDEALQFEGDTGPYLLYSYARAKSILRKAEKFADLKISKLENQEIDLIKKLSEFPVIVANSYNTLNPSLIANYSYQLAQTFNEFYHACQVVGDDEETFRLSLVKAFAQVLKNSLNLLGIETIEEM